jgi:purine-binding chemotaxis protein CheW
MRWGSLDGGFESAQPGEADVSEVATITVLLFEVGGQRHAVRLEEVNGVARSGELRPLPQPPAFVVGVIDRGDEPVPVVDLAAVLQLEATQARHVVLHNGPFGVVGFLVEEAAGVGEATIRPLPTQLRRSGGALKGLADSAVGTSFLLDLGAAVPEEMRENHARTGASVSDHPATLPTS